MINNWKDLSIKKYNQILNVDENLTPIEKDIEYISILSDTPTSELYMKSIEELNELRGELSFLEQKYVTSNSPIKKIQLNDWHLNVTQNINKMSVSQYVDFNMNLQEEKMNTAMMLACFLIPEGKRYNDGYDMVQLISDIEEHVNMQLANDLAFFLLRKSQRLIKVKVESLLLWMRVKKILTKNKTLKRLLSQKIQSIRGLVA